MLFFSRRKQPPKTHLDNSFPMKVRLRLFHTIRHLHDEIGDTEGFWEDVARLFLRTHGVIGKNGYNAEAFVKYWGECPTDHYCDMLEMTCCFTDPDAGWVSEANAILQDEGVAFALTDYERIYSHIERFPHLIENPEPVVHEGVIAPALLALARPIFKDADDELHRAFAAQRRGDFHSAIVAVGASFESVLKAICDAKKWPFNRQHDTLAKLIGICKVNGLFTGFYAPMFEAVGTVRNKLGAHGSPEEQPTAENVNHLIATTCSHIVFVIANAGI